MRGVEARGIDALSTRRRRDRKFALAPAMVTALSTDNQFMSDPRQLRELTTSILATPAPFRERLIDLVLLWNSVPKAARDDAIRRLEELAKTPSHGKGWAAELIAQLDRLVDELRDPKSTDRPRTAS